MNRLFHHATMHPCDPAAPDRPGANPPDAILTDGERIVAVGSVEELARRAPRGTERVDLAGAHVLPGMGDSHVHSVLWSRSLSEPDLRDCTSLEHTLDALRPFVERARRGGGQWVMGGQWNANAWDVPRFPNRHSLDSIAPDVPLALGSLDYHTVWLNSRALELLGLDRNTPDPPGGSYERDARGDLTGIAREAAVNPIRDGLMQSDDGGDLAERVLAGQRELLRRGITSIHDIDGADCLHAYQTLRERGDLGLRVHKALRIEQMAQALAEGTRTGSGDAWLSTGPLKLFADGALGSHTCHMSQPWPGSEDHGTAVTTREELEHWIATAARAGIATTVHAIGDRAATEVLDAFQTTRETARVFGLRQRMEHAQYLARPDLSRFRELGVTASMQPLHCTADLPMNDFLAERDLVAYGWRSLLDAGAHVVFGSDAPVEDPNPFHGIHAAITRAREGGPERGWQPEETVSRRTAVSLFSHAVARASYEENVKGCLAPGMLADFVAVDRDVFTVDAAAVRDTVVQATVVGGEVRYRL